jgi:hypothetical protein
MVLDTSVMNVSISQLVEDFDTEVTAIQATITLYTLVMAAGHDPRVLAHPVRHRRGLPEPRTVPRLGAASGGAAARPAGPALPLPHTGAA